MRERDQDRDWARRVPDHYRQEGPYEDYGWESRQSVLPEFRDPWVHDMPYERQYTPRYYAQRFERGRQGSPYGSPPSTRGMPGERGYRGEPFYGEPPSYGDEPYYGEPAEPGYGRQGWRSGRTAYGREGFYGRPSARSYGWEGESSRQPAWSYTEVWLIAGPFTGRGPQGYQRSDERIKEEVCERLTQHGQVDASDVEVSVQDGEVTLEGTVHNRREKRMAEDTVDTVPGVRDVHNHLRMQHGRGLEMEENPMGGVNLEL